MSPVGGKHEERLEEIRIRWPLDVEVMFEDQDGDDIRAGVMAGETRGQWIVCLRDIPSGEDEYLGPYHSEDKAHAVAERLRRDIAARDATGCLDAIVEWVRPGIEAEDMRDEMLASLDELGYVFAGRA